MTSRNKLILEQLDRKLEPFHQSKDLSTPDKGWIRAIRTALNMTLEQLGNRLGKSKQAAKSIELREESGSISLKNLREAAHAMDMELVYALLPKDGSFEQLMERKSRALAEKIVKRTHHNMQLEDQGNSQTRISSAIDDMTDEIKREMRRALWD